MVSMIELETIAANDSEIGEILNVATKFGCVRGTTLRPHPLWTRAMARQEALERNGLPSSYPFPFGLASDVWPDGEVEASLRERPIDWPAWLALLPDSQREAIDARPLLLTIIVARETSAEDVVSVQDAIAFAKIPIAIERRDPVRAQVAAAGAIVAGSTVGRIGCLLTNGNAYYAVTCSHVVGRNTNVTDRAGTTVGTVIGTMTLHPNAGHACDPIAKPAGLLINTIDTALIELHRPPAGTGLSAPSGLRHGQVVNYRVGITPHVCQVRSLSISMQIMIGSTQHCFVFLVETHTASGTTIPGDSGAPGVVSGNEWGLMVIGADSLSTFSMRASDALHWANKIRPGLTIY